MTKTPNFVLFVTFVVSWIFSWYATPYENGSEKYAQAEKTFPIGREVFLA